MSDKIYGIINGKHGKYEIIPPVFYNEHGTKCVKIRFLNTNNEKILSYKVAINGTAKDPDKPGVLGVGITDVPIKKHTKEYALWISLLNKIYNKNNRAYNIFGGSNITICEKWKRLSGFVEDLKQMDGYSE